MNRLLSKLGKKLAEVGDNISSRSPSATSSATAGVDDNAAADPCLEAQLRNVKSKLVRQLFHKHGAEEYTEWSDVGILVGSYNVNGKRPPPGLKLGDWLGALKDRITANNSTGSSGGETSTSGSGAGYPDVVVVGFQEIVPLSAGNVIVGSASRNIEAWDRALAVELNGEQWACSRYGPPAAGAAPPGTTAAAVAESAASTVYATAALTAAAAATAVGAATDPLAEALNRKWSGGASGSGHAANKTLEARIDTLTGGAGNQHLYFQIISKQMVGIYLTVWVRKRLLPHVRGVQTAVVATGFGGYLGNKGAVAARMYVHDTPLCFVNAHLSSGDKVGDEAKRNADVIEVLQRCDFAAAALYDQSMNSSAALMLASALGPGTWGSLRGIMDHTNAIWLGDLNYRLHGILDDEARKSIRAGQLGPLLEADQLRREMAAGRVFQGWKEGAINFPPTFKFKVGSHMYLGDAPSTASFSSTSASVRDEDLDDDGDDAGAPGAADGEVQKRRTPAWCDRILYTPVGALRQLAYVRGETTASDHKPVASRMLVHAAQYNRRKIEDLLQESRRLADMQHAAQRPRPSLEPNIVSLGTVRYGEVTMYRVTLSNAGPVEGLYHFVPPPSSEGLGGYGVDDAPGLPAWVTASPEEGYVPANASCDIELQVCVEGGPHGAAASLACNTNDYLDAIVILRVEDGSDLFLSLTGTYVRSSWLGLPLDGSAPEQPWAPVADLPAQMQLLLTFLQGAASLATQGLFVHSVQEVLGNGQGSTDGLSAGPSRGTQRALLQRLAPHINALEHDSSMLPQDLTAHEAAALLLLFLGELPRPVLTPAMIMLLDAASQAGQLPDAAAIPDVFLGNLLSPTELQLVKRLLELTRKVVASTATCVSTPDLANLLCLYLLPPLGPTSPAGAKERQQHMMRVLLE